MSAENRLGFIDGIKVFAMIMVFNIHILNAYYPGIYTLIPSDFHTVNGIEWWIGATPLNLVYAGKLGARIFLFLSAFLLARKYFVSTGESRPLLSCVKKYLRLVPMLLVVNLAAYGMMRLGWFVNDKAAVAAQSVEFFGGYNQFEPNLLDAVLEAVVGCFMFGRNRYNGPIWFIQYELWGCILVALLLKICGKQKWRYFVYAVLAVIFIRTDYLCMVLAVFVADITETKKEYVDKVTKYQWLLWIPLIVALYFGTYPSYGIADGTMYGMFPPKVLFYYNLAIPVMFFVFMQHKKFNHFLAKPIFKKITRYSYCFYLVHFPILCTFGAAVFLAGCEKMNYHLLFVIGYVSSFLLSLGISWVLTRVMDEPLGKLLGRCFKIGGRQDEAEQG